LLHSVSIMLSPLVPCPRVFKLPPSTFS
jgi:hypothetical protein